MKDQRTISKYPRVKRWEPKNVLNKAEARMMKNPDRMAVRHSTVKYSFRTIKSWMGSADLQMRTLRHVATDMGLYVLAYSLKHMMQMMGVNALNELLSA